MCKVKIYHVFTGALLIAAALTLAAAYGAEDVYHLLKYGPGNYRNVYNCFRPDLYIKPMLFLLSGVFYIRKRRWFFIFCLPIVLLLYIKDYDTILFSSYFRLIGLSELLGFTGFLLLCFYRKQPGAIYRMLPVMLESLSVFSSIRFLFHREYLVRIVSGIVFILYTIPLLLAYIVLEKELVEIQRRTARK